MYNSISKYDVENNLIELTLSALNRFSCGHFTASVLWERSPEVSCNLIKFNSIKNLNEYLIKFNKLKINKIKIIKLKIN
jgi:hypothetical protein